ncbi:MAG: YicC family protein [Bdellovibrionales bacterium]|nr:YicC family protein [Bdellovibrionales bacterium]
MIASMTGYASRVFNFQGVLYKIEIKSLNHRFLELKLRTPREWMPLETTIRSFIESKVKRGSVEMWIERAHDAHNQVACEIQINGAQVEHAFKQLTEVRKRLRLEEPITIRDIMTFPDVIAKGVVTPIADDALDDLSEVITEELDGAIKDLVAMRSSEGIKLQKALLIITSQLKKTYDKLIGLRTQIQKRAQEKVRRRIEQCFEAYSSVDAQMRALMESRIAQEIAYSLEKVDIEEELTRFKGHVEAIEKLLRDGGPIGKKLDFLFQELNREVNTLGNKSQDLDVSQDVILIKTWIEQLREQSLNIE